MKSHCYSDAERQLTAQALDEMLFENRWGYRAGE